MTGIVATMPVPMPWPEQDVRVVSEENSPQVRFVRYRVLQDGVKQMTVSIPRLAAGEKAFALVTLEVVKRDIVVPLSTDQLRVPSRLPRNMRQYLAPSPYIDSRDPKIREAARQLTANKSDAWQQVEAIFDWVREKVEYRFDRRIKSSRQALDDGFGDCEELTSLFVAMCRAADIPARAVWVPDHCYPEFYLEDGKGVGHWYPCQAAGSRMFGSMLEPKPILQKGDNFRVPGSRAPQRYVRQTLVAKHAVADPDVEFVQRNLDETAEDSGT
jgi:transglutaminase-like putative cysteine protease